MKTKIKSSKGTVILFRKRPGLMRTNISVFVFWLRLNGTTDVDPPGLQPYAHRNSLWKRSLVCASLELLANLARTSYEL